MAFEVDRHCVSCGARIGSQATVCPACGALNTQGAAAPARKRLKILWWTYTVQGTDARFIQARSAFGVTTTVSRGRWVVSNLLLVGLLTVMAFVWLAIWISSASATAGVGLLLFGFLDLLALAFFVWTMTPPRNSSR